MARIVANHRGLQDNYLFIEYLYLNIILTIMIENTITIRFENNQQEILVPIQSEGVYCQLFKIVIAKRIGSRPQNLIFLNQAIDKVYEDGEFITSFTKLVVRKIEDTSQQIALLANQQERQLQQNKHSYVTVRYFIMKSSNEMNIQIAKKKRIWATSSGEQRKLKQAFQENDQVILFFRTNKSTNLLGVAKMVSKPQIESDKSVWFGVENINLGGNFKIKWLCKAVVEGKEYQYQYNKMSKKLAGNSSNVQELDPSVAQKILKKYEEIKKQKNQQKKIALAKQPANKVPQIQTPLIPEEFLTVINRMNQVMYHNYKLERQKNKKLKKYTAFKKANQKMQIQNDDDSYSYSVSSSSSGSSRSRSRSSERTPNSSSRKSGTSSSSSHPNSSSLNSSELSRKRRQQYGKLRQQINKRYAYLGLRNML